MGACHPLKFSKVGAYAYVQTICNKTNTYYESKLGHKINKNSSFMTYVVSCGSGGVT